MSLRWAHWLCGFALVLFARGQGFAFPKLGWKSVFFRHNASDGEKKEKPKNGREKVEAKGKPNTRYSGPSFESLTSNGAAGSQTALINKQQGSHSHADDPSSIKQELEQESPSHPHAHDQAPASEQAPMDVPAGEPNDHGGGSTSQKFAAAPEDLPPKDIAKRVRESIKNKCLGCDGEGRLVDQLAQMPGHNGLKKALLKDILKHGQWMSERQMLDSEALAMATTLANATGKLNDVKKTAKKMLKKHEWRIGRSVWYRQEQWGRILDEIDRIEALAPYLDDDKLAIEAIDRAAYKAKHATDYAFWDMGKFWKKEHHDSIASAKEAAHEAIRKAELKHKKKGEFVQHGNEIDWLREKLTGKAKKQLPKDPKKKMAALIREKHAQHRKKHELKAASYGVSAAVEWADLNGYDKEKLLDQLAQREIPAELPENLQGELSRSRMMLERAVWYRRTLGPYEDVTAEKRAGFN